MDEWTMGAQGARYQSIYEKYVIIYFDYYCGCGCGFYA